MNYIKNELYVFEHKTAWIYWTYNPSRDTVHYIGYYNYINLSKKGCNELEDKIYLKPDNHGWTEKESRLATEKEKSWFLSCIIAKKIIKFNDNKIIEIW